MDNWLGMYEDPYAVRRLSKAASISQTKPGMKVIEFGSYHEALLPWLPDPVHYFPVDYEQFTTRTTVIDLNSLKPDILAYCPKASCDRLFALEVLEHLIRPELALTFMLRFLSKDGLAIISLPNEATLFHRLRALLGTVDAECFGECGKHLHLPSLSQTRLFLSKFGQILDWQPYINSSAKGSRQEWVGHLMRLLPDWLWLKLAHWLPSLFARGWIFLLKPYLPSNHPKNGGASDSDSAA